jgi:hypothetical protein
MAERGENNRLTLRCTPQAVAPKGGNMKAIVLAIALVLVFGSVAAAFTPKQLQTGCSIAWSDGINAYFEAAATANRAATRFIGATGQSIGVTISAGTRARIFNSGNHDGLLIACWEVGYVVLSGNVAAFRAPFEEGVNLDDLTHLAPDVGGRVIE